MSGVEKKIVADADDDIRVDKWFQRHYPALKFGNLSKLLRKGQIRVDGGRAKPGDRVHAGQEIRVPPLNLPADDAPKHEKPQVSDEDAAFLRSLVLYQDEDVIAINKPPGLPVQGGSGTTRHLDGMLDALRKPGGERPKLVHRLDKDTSGVLLLARSAKAAKALTAAFAGRDTQKTYWALVMGQPEHERGRIEMKMDKLPGRGGERMVRTEDGKRSVTDFHRIDSIGRKASWMALRPITGRTHQLRLHMAEIGHPIVGDGKYGGAEAFLGGSVSKKMHLHARSIALPRARGTLVVTAPLPSHMQETWALLDFNEDDGQRAFTEEE